ncbi:hypothetical protein EG329_010080 [Mollisiaceae sp. DMI_Dod_QoI]|nr:hypothetical protein EG329_010080 [Helotiales sp. DMI_Dod_QoI]
MLPSEHMATYRRYKEDTKLPEKYARAPFPHSPTISTLAPSGRIKGKERKLAKAKAAAMATSSTSSTLVVKLPTAVLLAQAKHLSNTKPPIEVPTHIQVALERAIRSRQRCSEWFAGNARAGTGQTSQAGDKLSTAMHEFFTQCLKKIQDILRPLFQLAQPPKSTTAQNLGTSKSQIALDNRFEALEVEDVNDDDTVDVQKVSQRNKSAPKKLQAEKSDACELDQAIEDDLPFFVWCYFEDLHRLQDFLVETWKQHSHGKLHVSVAAIVTSIALELVQKSEEELVQLAPNRFRDAETTQYRSILKYVCTENDLKNVQNSTASWAYFPEYVMLRRRTTISSHWAPCREPFPIPEWIASSVGFAPLMKSAELISHMVLDLHYMHATTPKEREAFFESGSYVRPKISFPSRTNPYLDAITKGIYTVCTKSTTVSSVFMALILCDINRVLGKDVKDRYMELRQQGAAANRLLGLDWSKVCQGADPKMQTQIIEDLLPSWGSADAVIQAAKTLGLIREAIMTNTLGCVKRCSIIQPGHMWDVSCGCCPQTAMQRCPGMVWPSKDPVYAYNHNPVYCGMESLKLAVMMEKTGIQQYHQGCEIMTVAHLYNMVKQQKDGLKGRWDFLEATMERFKSEMFHGSFPTKPDEMVKRFMVCCGIKASELAPTARKFIVNKLQESSMRKWPDIIKGSAISDSLERYLDGNSTGEKFIHEINRIHRMGQAIPETGLTQLELLVGLRDAVQKSLPQIQFDYITLNRDCRALLERVRGEMETKLNFSFLIDDDASKISCLSIGIQLIPAATGGETYRAFRDKLGINRKDPAFRSEVIGLLANIFDTFIDELKANKKEEPATPFSIDLVTSFVDGFVKGEYKKSPEE